MYLIDTCTLSDYLRGDDIVVHRLNQVPKADIWISVVNVHEVLNGATGHINGEKDPKKLDFLFNRLVIIVNELPKFQVLPFDANAQSYLSSFPTGNQISPNDKMIACVAKANGKIVVTTNTRHFKVLLPESQLQDWTRPD